jgi:hypothetical protein
MLHIVLPRHCASKLPNVGSTMKKSLATAVALPLGMLVLASALPEAALGQSGNPRPGAAADARSTDMRLWSFGECDRNFPAVDGAAHRECVRVVGSEEAKDARAVHFCETSHAKDPIEAKRCKDAYFANKDEAEQAGFRGNAAGAQPIVATATPEPKKVDKAAEIAAMTRALIAPDPEEPAAAAAPAPEPVPPAPAPPPPSSFSAGGIIVGLSVLLLLVALAMRYLRGATGVSPVTASVARRTGAGRTVSPGTGGPRTGGGPRTKHY